VLALLLVYNAGTAQEIIVKDSLSGLPLEGVVITGSDSHQIKITGKDGSAQIKPLLDDFHIRLDATGYRSVVLRGDALGDPAEVRMIPLNYTLDEVVVSATRWRQTKSRIPNSIAVLDAEQIALQNPQTAADLLAISGKVFIQKSQQGGGSPMIRGFATNRLIYTVDGVRMNNAIFRGGNIQNVINIDPFTVERTEVLFGPESVIYGSDAIGGVMSFHTKTPAFSKDSVLQAEGQVQTRFASANNEKTIHGECGISGNKWALFSALSYWDYDHLRQGSHGPDDYIKDDFVRFEDSTDVILEQEDRLLQIPSAYKQFNMLHKLRVRPDQYLDMTLGLHHSRTSSYGRYDRHNRERNGLPRYGQWDYGPQRWTMNTLALQYNKPAALFDLMGLRLAYQIFEESRITRNFGSIERLTREEKVNAYSANLDLIKAHNRRFKSFYGLEGVLNDVQSRGLQEDILSGESDNASARYPASRWASAAVYYNAELDASDKLTLSGGFRYNHFWLDADFRANQPFYPLPVEEASISDGAVTGSLGLAFRPSSQWILKANFGTAFRSPNVDDIGKTFDSEPGSVVVPNPSLDAEYAYNMDFAAARTFAERLKINLAAYYTRLENVMVRRDFILNGMDSIEYDGVPSRVQAIQNLARAEVYGIQVGIEWRIGRDWRLVSDINFQEGEEENDDGTVSPSRHAAPVFGVTRLSYSGKSFKLQAYLNYQGGRTHEELAIEERSKTEIYALDERGLSYAPAWYTANIKGSWQVSDRLSISGGIENITDRRYRPYSSGISGAGRNFIVSISGRL